MRPINSEPLLKEIRRLKEKASTFGHPDYRLGYISALSVVEGLIASEDKIDAEPVRHGHNVTPTHHSDMFMCSECGFTCEIIELRYGDDGMSEPDAYEYDCKFCPNCGAKMDEEVQHD